jgi:tellurite resistance protein TerC
MTGHPVIWIAFSILVLTVLALDLGVFHRKAHAVGFREALRWTGVWVTLAVLFGIGVWHWAGPQKGLEFFTGYIIDLTSPWILYTRISRGPGRWF